MSNFPHLFPTSGYRPQSIDTRIDADIFLFQRFAKMPLWKKAQLIIGVTQGCRQLCLRGIKNQYSQASLKEINQLYRERILGDNTVNLLNNRGLEQEVMIGNPVELALLIAEILEGLNISYLIGGSVASSLWGESRATLDVDIVADLTFEKVSGFIDAVISDFYVSEEAVRDAISYQSSFNIIHLETNEKVDIFILSSQPLAKQEMSRRQLKEVTEDGRSLYLSTPEDIILQKLIWYRLGNQISDRQWRDILGVLKAQGSSLDFKYLYYWCEQEQLSDLLEYALIQAGLS